MANPLGEGESEFAALNMVDSRIGCAVAGRYGPHHRPARRTIPVCCIPTIQRRVHPLSLRREREKEREIESERVESLAFSIAPKANLHGALLMINPVHRLRYSVMR